MARNKVPQQITIWLDPQNGVATVNVRGRRTNIMSTEGEVIPDQDYNENVTRSDRFVAATEVYIGEVFAQLYIDNPVDSYLRAQQVPAGSVPAAPQPLVTQLVAIPTVAMLAAPAPAPVTT